MMVQQVLENTRKLTLKNTCFSYKDKDNWKVLCSVCETDKRTISDN